MDIFLAEVKKIFSQKLTGFLILLALAMNACVICSNLYYRENLAYVNEIAGKTGIEITEASLAGLQKLYAEKVGGLIQAYQSKTGRKLESLDDFSSQFLGEAFQKQVREAELLSRMMDSAGDLYHGGESLSPDELLDEALAGTGGKALGSVIKWQYKMLDNRLRSLNTSGERLYLSQSMVLDMHSFLFSGILFSFYIEMMIIAAILTFKSAGHEFSEGTEQLVYATKRGRGLQKDKLLACFFAAAVIFAAVGLVTLLAYFLVYPQWNFFKMPVSAGLYGGIVSKAPLTLVQYLLVNTGFALLLTLIFSAVSYVIGLYVKKPYPGLLSFFLLQMGCLLAGMNAYSGSLSLPGAAAILTPVTAIFSLDHNRNILRNSASWFALTGSPASLPFFEAVTAAVWIALCIILGKAGKRWFSRMDL